MAATRDAIEIFADVIAREGPLQRSEVARLLQDRGVEDPDSALQWNLIEIDCPARQLVDDRWVWLPSLLTGRVFTHRVSAPELHHDVLSVTPDLSAITALCEHAEYQRLADGSVVQIVVAGYDDELLDERGVPAEAIDSEVALLLERGSLAKLGVDVGDTVGLRLTARGLSLERLDVGPARTAGEWLPASLDADEPTDISAATWSACAADPRLFFDPLPPLSEIIEEQGLVHRGELLAPQGFDLDAWQFGRRCALLSDRHGLDLDDAVTLASLIELHKQVSQVLAEADVETGVELTEADPSLGVVSELGAQLADPLLAELLVAETVGADRGKAAALGLLAEMLERRVPRAARVACRWLRAVALEQIGDIAEAERELLAAESMDPDWPLPLLDLARFASDRGDVERGLALLRRAGAGQDHPLVQLLQSHRAAPRSDLGRNEPCWCGSGHKYKKCHLGHEQLALADRLKWLYAKAIEHAFAAGWRDLVLEIAFARYRYTHELDEAIDAGMADPLVMDLVLFEGGAFAEFLELRGSLLPDDERLLAEQWLLVERSVFDVKQVQPGAGITVRDVRTGETLEVRERTASRQLEAGQLICARVVPDGGEELQIFGGLEPVALHERDSLVRLLDAEPGPAELVEALSRRFAPPTLTNTEGEPLLVCEATVRFSDLDAVTTALDETYDRVSGEDPPRWLEQTETHHMPSVRATLIREGDTLKVETDSAKRMDRVLTTLVRLDPSLRIIVDERRPISEFGDAPERTGHELSPEVAAALDEYIREYEAKWLDEPIPALNGYTPRAAADDPTRRDDLIRLLDSFPADDGAPGRMSRDRLRVALGLV